MRRIEKRESDRRGSTAELFEPNQTRLFWSSIDFPRPNGQGIRLRIGDCRFDHILTCKPFVGNPNHSSHLQHSLAVERGLGSNLDSWEDPSITLGNGGALGVPESVIADCPGSPFSKAWTHRH